MFEHKAEPTQQCGIHDAASPAVGAVQDTPGYCAIQYLGLADLVHGMLPTARNGTAGT
jgi:hypothetical protein